jgi:hypothetical protein
MQPIKQSVFDRMQSVLQLGDKAPNFRIQLRNSNKEAWVDVNKQDVQKIDIDTKLDFDASTCDFTLSNVEDVYNPERVGNQTLWRTIFQDQFNTDSRAKYSAYEGFAWKKDAIKEYNGDTRDDGFNGYTESHGQSKLEFKINLTGARARMQFEFRKGSGNYTKTGSSAQSASDNVFFYDDFNHGLKSVYRFKKNGKCDNWIIRNYKGLKVMSSGYCLEKTASPDLILPIDVPVDSILEYRHRLIIPRVVSGANLRHRLYDGNKSTIPPIPAHPINLPPYTVIEAPYGAIELGGFHGGANLGKWEHHQHKLSAGHHDLIFTTWFEGKKELAHWEMSYIKIFADPSATIPAETEGSGEGVSMLSVYVDGILKRYVTVSSQADWTKLWSDWHIIEGEGEHTIKIIATSGANKYVTDIDNIIVQEEILGNSAESYDGRYFDLVTPNTQIKVWLGYGDSDADLILRFTGLVDKVVRRYNGTLDVFCRDNMKHLIETMVKPKHGEFGLFYPENGMKDWWVVSDVIADLINHAGLGSLVERTMITVNGVDKPYVLPAIRFEEGKPIMDCIKEVADGINYRCWANRAGIICLNQIRYKGQADPEDFTLTDYVDLTDLEQTLDDADARGLLRVVCNYNKQSEVYMDKFLHNKVCKGFPRYASAESEWMQIPSQRKIYAQFVFRQMKRKYRTLTVGTQGNPFIDCFDHVKVMELDKDETPKKYSVIGIRTSLSKDGYLDIYDLEYGADLDSVVLISSDNAYS